MKGLLIGGLALIILLSGCTPSDPELDAFAQCLTDSGATFYGAWWCPHCADQKDAFGSAMKNILYVECSTPDGNSQTPACVREGIKGYPTWKFDDGGEDLSGFVSLDRLAARTGCPLP